RRRRPAGDRRRLPSRPASPGARCPAVASGAFACVGVSPIVYGARMLDTWLREGAATLGAEPADPNVLGEETVSILLDLARDAAPRPTLPTGGRTISWATISPDRTSPRLRLASVKSTGRGSDAPA